jgi:hypothetical protein
LNAAFYEYKYAVDFASETRIVSDPCTRYGGFRDQNAGLAVGGSRPRTTPCARCPMGAAAGTSRERVGVRSPMRRGGCISAGAGGL